LGVGFRSFREVILFYTYYADKGQLEDNPIMLDAYKAILNGVDGCVFGRIHQLWKPETRVKKPTKCCADGY
jgi:hypothetical protein